MGPNKVGIFLNKASYFLKLVKSKLVCFNFLFLLIKCVFLLETLIIFAPLFKKYFDKFSPKPDDAPVIKITLFLNSLIIFYLTS